MIGIVLYGRAHNDASKLPQRPLLLVIEKQNLETVEWY